MDVSAIFLILLLPFALVASFLLLKAFRRRKPLIPSQKFFDQRLQDESSLRESEHRYRQLFENRGLGVIVADIETTSIEDVNQTAVEMYGYSKEEFLKLSVYDISAEKDLTKSVIDRIKNGQPGKLPVIYRKQLRKDGSVFDSEVFVAYFNSKKRLKIFGIIQDITERKQNEAKVLLQIERMRALRESLQKLNACQTNKKAYGAAVQSVMKVLGCDRSSILLFGEDQKVHFEAWHELSDGYRQAVDGHCPWQQNEIDAEPISMPDIEKADISEDLRICLLGEGIRSAAFFPLIADDKLLGKYMGYFGQPHELTDEEINYGKILAAELVSVLERLKYMEKLDQSERRFALAMDGTNDGIWDWNIQSGAVYYSPRWETMLGYDVGEVEPNISSCEKLIHPDDIDEVMSVLTEHLEGRRDHYQTEHRVGTKDGNWIWILDRGKVVEWDGEGKPLRAVGTHTDISYKKEAEAEKASMARQMEHAQRLDALGVLAGGIAHDFNNILAAIMGNAAMAERKADDNPEAVQGHLETIVKSSERAALLCKQMLAYSGQGQFIIKPLGLSVLVNDITSLLEVSINSGVELHYQLTEKLPLINADESQIQQVVMNLVINASDAIGTSGGVITLSTGVVHVDSSYFLETQGVQEQQEGSYVFLTVVDTGCGMEEKVRRKLFEPFFTTKFTGRGLGMSAVLGIVRSHHGTIKVESEAGKGTTFHLLFPVAEEELTGELTENICDSDCQASGTILVVDDEKVVRDVAVMMLEDMGYETLTAIDGVDGVEVYKEHQDKISAVLLDMTMPKMDGKACFHEIQGFNKDAIVILSSGYNELEATSNFSGMGLAGFIQKPYKPEVLQQLMHSLTED